MKNFILKHNPGVSVMWGATSYTVSESRSVLELVLLIEGSTSFNFTLLVSTYNGSATGECDRAVIANTSRQA